MSLLTSLFARTRRKNQQTIAARTAAVIDHVIYDVGIDALVNGTLLLDKRMRPRFIGSRSVAGPDVIAVVAVRELAEAEVFRTLGYSLALDRSTLNVHTGCLVFAVMREFKAQSPVFRSLP